MPVNWLGDGGALLSGARALFDGNLDPVVELPPGRDLRPAVWDVNGDGVDELLKLVDGTVHVYGPETIPANPTGGEQRTMMTNAAQYGGLYL